jgi:hypothetical protein
LPHLLKGLASFVVVVLVDHHFLRASVGVERGKTVDGGQVWSMRATENKAGDVAFRARIAASK